MYKHKAIEHKEKANKLFDRLILKPARKKAKLQAAGSFMTISIDDNQYQKLKAMTDTVNGSMILNIRSNPDQSKMSKPAKPLLCRRRHDSTAPDTHL